MTRRISIITLYVLALQAQAIPSVQQPLQKYRGLPVPFAHPVKVSSTRGFPATRSAEPFRPYPFRGSSSRVLPVVRADDDDGGDSGIPLNQFFSKTFAAPASSMAPIWYKVLEEKGQCIQSEIDNLVPFSFEYAQLSFGGWKQGTCADAGFTSNAPNYRINVPGVGESVVSRFSKAALTKGSSVLSMAFIASAVSSGVALVAFSIRRNHYSAAGGDPLLSSA
jgi:hypothetical protein